MFKRKVIFTEVITIFLWRFRQQLEISTDSKYRVQVYDRIFGLCFFSNEQSLGKS